MIFFFSDFAPIPSSEGPIGAGEAWERAKLLTEATSVCSRFCGVLREASEFWNVVIFTPMGMRRYDDIVKHIIRRSGQRLIHVVWDCRGHRNVISTPCVESLHSVNITRICTVSIRLSSRCTSPTAGVFDTLIPLPSLRATHVECHDGCTEVPFVPYGPLTKFLTIASECLITNLDRHVEVYFPPRLAATLLSLTIHISIDTTDMNDYLSEFRALLHLEWSICSPPTHISFTQLVGEPDRKQVLFLPKTLKTVFVSHPTLVPILRAPSLTHVQLDIHDHQQIDVTPWEGWNLYGAQIPLVKSIWLSCPCIATNGVLDGMLDSAAEELEELNIGVEAYCPQAILFTANALRRLHTPLLRSISFGILPHPRFHGMWGRVATRFGNLLTECHGLRIHCAFISDFFPTPMNGLVEQYGDRFVLHAVPDEACLRETMKDL
jgi:hypothetical protein